MTSKGLLSLTNKDFYKYSNQRKKPLKMHNEKLVTKIINWKIKM